MNFSSDYCDYYDYLIETTCNYTDNEHELIKSQENQLARTRVAATRRGAMSEKNQPAAERPRRC